MEETSKHGIIGSTSILLWRKDWSSIRHDRTPSFFTKHFQVIVSRKLFGWKLEKSYTRKYMRHLGLLQRFPWKMIEWRNWVQKLLDNQTEKLLDKQTVSKQLNQTQIQITIERGDPLFAHKLSAQCQTRLTSTSEYLDCHILLWSKLRTIVFVSSLSRSRTTLTDKIFNEIYNKIMPTTHLVKNPRKWWRTWAM